VSWGPIKQQRYRINNEYNIEKRSRGHHLPTKSESPALWGASHKKNQQNIEVTIPSLLHTFKTMLYLRRTFDFINKGMITLILKFGHHSKIRNWPLITMFKYL